MQTGRRQQPLRLPVRQKDRKPITLCELALLLLSCDFWVGCYSVVLFFPMLPKVLGSIPVHCKNSNKNLFTQDLLTADLSKKYDLAICFLSTFQTTKKSSSEETFQVNEITTRIKHAPLFPRPLIGGGGMLTKHNGRGESRNGSAEQLSFLITKNGTPPTRRSRSNQVKFVEQSHGKLKMARVQAVKSRQRSRSLGEATASKPRIQTTEERSATTGRAVGAPARPI